MWLLNIHFKTYKTIIKIVASSSELNYLFHISIPSSISDTNHLKRVFPFSDLSLACFEMSFPNRAKNATYCIEAPAWSLLFQILRIYKPKLQCWAVLSFWDERNINTYRCKQFAYFQVTPGSNDSIRWMSLAFNIFTFKSFSQRHYIQPYVV